MNASAFRKLALSFPDTTEAAHFDRAAFRTPRRIFATMLEREASANLKLSPAEQSALLKKNPKGIEAVSGGWGRLGWTTLALAELTTAEVKPLLALAHASAAPAPKKPKRTTAPKKKTAARRAG